MLTSVAESRIHNEKRTRKYVADGVLSIFAFSTWVRICFTVSIYQQVKTFNVAALKMKQIELVLRQCAYTCHLKREFESLKAKLERGFESKTVYVLLAVFIFWSSWIRLKSFLLFIFVCLWIVCRNHNLIRWITGWLFCVNAEMIIQNFKLSSITQKATVFANLFLKALFGIKLTYVTSPLYIMTCSHGWWK